MLTNSARTCDRGGQSISVGLYKRITTSRGKKRTRSDYAERKGKIEEISINQKDISSPIVLEVYSLS
jgi:hypothetical protein